MKKSLKIFLLITLITALASYSYAGSPDNLKCIIEEMGQESYHYRKQAVDTEREKPLSIEDFFEAKDILREFVLWKSDPDFPDADNYMLDRIVFRNGGEYICDDYFYFTAYFPEEDILLFEGGHCSEHAFNLTTGEDTDQCGNPQYIIKSPAGTYRLNGYHSGQECSYHFIQQYIDGRYRKVLDLDKQFEAQIGTWLCNMYDLYWPDETTLNFKTYNPSSENGEWDYHFYSLRLFE